MKKLIQISAVIFLSFNNLSATDSISDICYITAQEIISITKNSAGLSKELADKLNKKKLKKAKLYHYLDCSRFEQ